MYKSERFYCFKWRAVSLLHPSGEISAVTLFLSNLLSHLLQHMLSHTSALLQFCPSLDKEIERNEMLRKREEEGSASNLWQAGRLSSLMSFLSVALPHCLCYVHYFFQQGSFSSLIPNIPVSFLSLSGYVYGSAYASPSLLSARCVLVSLATDDII